MRIYYLFLAIILLSFTASGQNNFYDGDHGVTVSESSSGAADGDGEIEYGEPIEILAWCDPETGTCGAAGGGESSRKISVDGCSQENINVGLEPESAANNVYNYSGYKISEIPSEIHCSLGEYELELIDDSHPDNPVLATDTFSVTAEGMSDPNKGRYIVTRFGLEQQRVEDFFLTNKPWYDCDGSCGIVGFNEFPERGGGNDPSSGPRPIEKGAFFLISERDGGLAIDKSDEGIVIADYGKIIDGWGDSIADYEWGKYYEPESGWACAFTGAQSSQNKCKNDIKGVMNLGFGEDYGQDYDQKCSVAQNNFVWNSCSPLHKNGVYEPQGEIIIASEMDRQNLMEISDIPFAIDDSTYFFVCRGDYRGTDRASSKMVKVQEDVSGSPLTTEYEWTYYRCNMNNDWEEVECEPGTSLQEAQEDVYECEPEEPVTVDVEFFNLSDVPMNNAQTGFVTGFKIDSDEMDKYNQLMGTEVESIDAECWMGHDDKRPTDENDVGTFQVDYSGYGDAWVLGQIPFRESVSNSTYSCAWGFSDEAEYSDYSPPVRQEHGIFESTRHPPLRSVDSGKINIDYAEIENQYGYLKSGNRIDESPSRDDLWTPYSSGDTRSYVTDTNEDMFSYINSFPYCETPTNPESILENILCG